jgi:signal transduction histidine kinase
MRSHRWQSIRWRLALGSVLLALVTTSLLALIVVFVINYYYTIGQQENLGTFAKDHAQRISLLYGSNNHNLSLASSSALQNLSAQDQQMQIIVIGRSGIVYPYSRVSPLRKGTFARSVLALIDPQPGSADQKIFLSALTAARAGRSTTDEFKHSAIINGSQPFSVQPIFSDTTTGTTNITAATHPPVVGIFVTTIRTDALPPFVDDAGIAVAVASIIIAALAALTAILFSQTITRPLTRLTSASRVLAQGNYDARVPVNAPGEIGELSHTFNDMAAQLKRDVDELRQQETLRRELIMNVTHDLATPLTSIAGLGEALIDGVNQSREDYEATGRVIVRETARLRRLVQDLTMMAKVESNAVHPHCAPLRLAALVDEVFAAMIVQFERHQVEPINAVAYDLPVIEADADMLTRVFANLCGNALRYTPSGGSITIAAYQQQSSLLVTVTDTGEGIPPESLPRIFERFYRADNSRQTATGGSGLGLAIVRALVQAHGGSIWAENAPGAGARICFTLPLPSQSSVTPFSANTMPLPDQDIHAALHSALDDV